MGGRLHAHQLKKNKGPKNEKNELTSQSNYL